MSSNDMINSPRHYNSMPNGIECVDVAEHFDFLLGNVIKYIMRHEHKGAPIEDLKKARWYLDRKIQNLEKGVATDASPAPPTANGSTAATAPPLGGQSRHAREVERLGLLGHLAATREEAIASVRKAAGLDEGREETR